MNVLPEVTAMPMLNVSMLLVVSNASAQLISLSEMVLQESFIESLLYIIDYINDFIRILSKPSKAASPILMTSSLLIHQAKNQLQQHLHQLPVVVMLSMISTALVKVCSVKSQTLPKMSMSHASVHLVVSNVSTHQNHQTFLESSVKTLERPRNKDGRMATR